MQTQPAVRGVKRVSILSGQSRSSPRSPVSRPLEAHLKAPRHPPSSPKARRHHKQFRKIRRRLFPLRSRPLRLHSHEGSLPVPGCKGNARQGGRPLTQKFTPQRHQLHIYHREVPPNGKTLPLPQHDPICPGQRFEEVVVVRIPRAGGKQRLSRDRLEMNRCRTTAMIFCLAIFADGEARSCARVRS